MQVPRIVTATVKRMIDVPTWIGYKEIVETTKSIGQLIKDTFTPQKSERTETFEEALKRLNLTEKDVKQRIKTFTFLSIFWLLIAIFVLGYGVYMADIGSWLSFIASFSISLVCLTQAFRFHFWLYQMKQRRLGCTFREWLNANVIGDKS